MNDDLEISHIIHKDLPIEATPVQPPAVIESEPVASGDDIQDDYELARKTLRDLVVTSTQALEGIANLAKTSEHPRAYEVLGQMIKTTGETAKELLDLQKQKQVLSGEDSPSSSGDTHIGNAIFVGSTSDLQNLIKERRAEQKIIEHDDS